MVLGVANCCIGFGVGLVDTAQFTLLGLFFKYGDYGNNYGSIYAIGDLAFCIAFSLGPVVTSTLSNAVGFLSTLQILACFIRVQLSFEQKIFLAEIFNCFDLQAKFQLLSSDSHFDCTSLTFHASWVFRQRYCRIL